MLKVFPNRLKKADSAYAEGEVDERSDQDAVLPSHRASVAPPNTASFQAGATGEAYLDSCCSVPVVISGDIWEKLGKPPITGKRNIKHFSGASDFSTTTLDLNLAGLTLLAVEAVIDDSHSQLVVIGKPILNYFIMTMDRDSVKLVPNLKKVEMLESYRPIVSLLKIRRS